MEAEQKTCQNCKQDFTIEPEDLGFYEQVSVPPPTRCPRCRLIRRLSWQGYRILYKRKCDKTGESVISTHPQSSSQKIYKQDVWWSDDWDPRDYGRDYDFSRPFFEQFRELLSDVPLPALHTEYTNLINSDYCNAASGLKNCYLVFRVSDAEDSAYLNMIVDAKRCFDVSYSNFIELCHDSVELQKCFQVFSSQDCEESHHIWFSRDLVGCSYCIGCANLRNKSYCIFNEQYSKEEYEKKVKEFNLGSWQSRRDLQKKAAEFLDKQPHRGFHGLKNSDVDGEYIYNSKNVHNSYMVRNAENVRYSQFLKNGPTANCYDYSIFSDGAEWIYDSCWVGLNTQNVKFGFWSYRCHDVEYCFGCMGAGNCFGCVGIRKTNYCILNKQYSKDEYQEIVAKIKEQMTAMPYKDILGREYRYGEFFPSELCPWKYNESTAFELWPLSQEEAISKGFGWREKDEREYKEQTIEIPDNIEDVSDDILKAVLKCRSCGKNYLLIPAELEFYRQFHIPVPRQCSFCRYLEQVSRLKSIESVDRPCSKCNSQMSVPADLKEKEIVYCDDCYRAEVI